MNATLEQLTGYSAKVKPVLAGLNLPPRRVILYQDADDNSRWWTVECPTLLGCVSQGETVEMALENIREAMELWLETALEMGDFVPAADARKSMF